MITLANKAIIYIKQTGGPQIGGPQIPVTVRVEWLADGKIKPLTCWTPDNSCYDFKYIYESTQLAFLKERGEGIRYKVRAESKYLSEHDGLRHTWHDIYLYFADNRFCEKGFIDERYKHKGKKYVPVILDIFPDGDYELVYFWVGDNRYRVERTNNKEPRGSFHAGGIGIRHNVDVRLVNPDNDEDPDPNKSIRRPAALYWELNKWFIANR